MVAVLKPLVVIAGPTASGKTALALALAEKFGGEIVSCDSVAVYREMEIGTAKPTHEERARVPHHCLDLYNPDETCTAGDYARHAREALAGIAERGRVAILTGGTGLYLRALVDGLFAGPPRSEGLREKLRARESGHLHKILRRLDAGAAAKIHANDAPKLIRAIEVCIAGRQKITEAWEQGRDALEGYRILRVGLNPERARLYERINCRAAEMFERGLVEETKVLVERYTYDCRPLTSLGYAQAVGVLRDQLTMEQAVMAAQQGHRNYAKRQLTWFRKDAEMQWLNGCGDAAETLAAAGELVGKFLRATAAG